MGIFDTVKQGGELMKMRQQAMQIQKALAAEKIEIEESGIRIVVSGDQKIQELQIDGANNQRLVDTINKALKKSQEVAAKKMQEMSGGLSGMLKAMGQ
ncbi:YbaB/EbfC family nucleoid-associated protein [Candidatus Beckwithbacteria bacterium]|nr:YbaB/EbfC family nucleoid-associated protein [Candidatus Beckwithbacteria bacterium]